MEWDRDLIRELFNDRSLPVSVGDSFVDWVAKCLSTMKVDHGRMFVMALWSIWRARNAKVWEQKTIPVSCIVADANAMLEGWSRAQEGVHNSAQRRGSSWSWS
ncbi:unnamed protein product [Cuscuta epithymum]|uniref:Uncharacterized protein n=1 Tax=Cuscuta epithymum TaxID=186058 RepID=A0AAV0CM74_9ASTE|nr:unnamed protein product [Cuscuta epithymum]